VKEAIALHQRGMTYEQIAQKYGVTKSTIHEQLQGVFALLAPDRLDAYRHHRTAILDAMELEMLNLLTDPTKREKATLGNVGYVFERLHQARRLEQGESTANVALHALVESIERERATPTRGGDRQISEAGAT